MAEPADLNARIAYARGWNDAVRAAARTARFYSSATPSSLLCKSIADEIEKLDLSMQATSG
jgi:hypothetical protein